MNLDEHSLSKISLTSSHLFGSFHNNKWHKLDPKLNFLQNNSFRYKKDKIFFKSNSLITALKADKANVNIFINKTQYT